MASHPPVLPDELPALLDHYSACYSHEAAIYINCLITSTDSTDLDIGYRLH
ncbi:hypothetical protein DSUL_100118 [Desulfovibrionales bacterium]